MRSRRPRLPELVTVALILTTAACGSAAHHDNDAASAPAQPTGTVATTPPTSPVSLSETGSTLLYPLISDWGAAYSRHYPNVTVSTQGSGSGAGIAQVAAGAVDIGASDAYLSEGDLTAHPGLINIALAVSAQQINYNLPGVTDPIRLNGRVLAGMYDGTITTWNDPQITALNPGMSLPDTAVVPLHRSDGSGDTFQFTQYLSKQDPDGWGNAPGFGTTVDFPVVPGALGENGNGAMITGCATNPGCIAYVSISQRDEARDRHLGEALLANAAGNYLAPDAESIRAAAADFADQTTDDQAVSLINGPSADSYPIVNYEYAIVNATQTDARTAQTLQAFLHWAITDGSTPAFLDKVHLQPLPDAVTKVSVAQIARIAAS